MPGRVDLVLRAKCSSEIRNSRTEHQQRVAHFLLALRIPLWHLERPWALLGELSCVLHGVYLLNVLRIIRIDQRAQRDQHVTRTDLIPVIGVTASAINHVANDIVILIDHLHRPEARAGIRQRDRYRPCIKIDHNHRVKGVAIGSNNALSINGHWLAMMIELADAAGILDGMVEVEVGLGPSEVINTHGDCLKVSLALWHDQAPLPLY